MLLHFLYFCVVIHSITCAFPTYIEKCPKSDPNANNCILNKAKKGFAVLIHGDKNLDLPGYKPFKIVYELPLGNNANILLMGEGNPTNVQITQARIDLQHAYWYFVFNTSLITVNVNFTVNIKNNNNIDVIAKGRANLDFVNWSLEYFGKYDTVTINNEKYMQIANSTSTMRWEKYRQKITDLKTLDNKKLSESNRKEVQNALKNLETSILNDHNNIGTRGITLALDTILKLEPESEVFLH